MGHAKADRLLIRPTHGDRAGAGSEGRTSPIQGTRTWAVQFWGHALATATSLRSLRQEPVDATLTFSFRPPLTSASLTLSLAVESPYPSNTSNTPRVLRCRGQIDRNTRHEV
jgi:hypothetical protein